MTFDPQTYYPWIEPMTNQTLTTKILRLVLFLDLSVLLSSILNIKSELNLSVVLKIMCKWVTYCACYSYVTSSGAQLMLVWRWDHYSLFHETIQLAWQKYGRPGTHLDCIHLVWTEPTKWITSQLEHTILCSITTDVGVYTSGRSRNLWRGCGYQE